LADGKQSVNLNGNLMLESMVKHLSSITPFVLFNSVFLECIVRGQTMLYSTGGKAQIKDRR